MTANVNVTKVLFKRGNTAQNATYTGINGEITVDTQAKTLRIHDGVTAGGNVIIAGGVVGSYSNTNAAAYIPTDPTITSLQSNAGIQATAINTINANIGAYQTYANANAAGQTTEINSLRANITAANTLIPNLSAVSGNILPSANVTYSLGSAQFQWKDLWVAGNVIATSVSTRTVITTPVTFANLVAVSGARAFVNDANIAAAGNFGALISGGGANTAPVWSDGVNWYIG